MFCRFNPKVQEARSHRAAGKLPRRNPQQIQQHEPCGHALRLARSQTELTDNEAESLPVVGGALHGDGDKTASSPQTITS